MRRVGQRERPHLPSRLPRRDPNLAEEVLHVDAGADEEVAEREGDERERDRGRQVRAAVLGQELLRLLRPRLPRLPLLLLPFLGAEHFPEAELEAVLLGDLLGRLGLPLLGLLHGGEPPPGRPRGGEEPRLPPLLQQPVLVPRRGRGGVGEEESPGRHGRTTRADGLRGKRASAR